MNERRRKNERIKIVGIFIAVTVPVLLALWNLDSICEAIILVKNDIKDLASYKLRNEDKVDLSNISKLEDEINGWYTNYHFISHSGGGIDGRIYTNSLEAWDLSYTNGNRVIDADFIFTSDDRLVLAHSWVDNLEMRGGAAMLDSQQFTDGNGSKRYIIDYSIPTYNEFMSEKIFYKYTPLSCEDVIDYMKVHPDLYVACDMKDDFKKSYSYLVNSAKKSNYEDVLDRIIVNIYDFSLYEEVLSVYPFRNFVVRQHTFSPLNYSEIVSFCCSNNIHCVNMSSQYIDDPGAKLLIEYGIHVYVAVCDDVDIISAWDRYFDIGGVVSNYLYEDDWVRIEH